jgi:photosystem II stability/assembly factor-like uncharacterized protein
MLMVFVAGPSASLLDAQTTWTAQVIYPIQPSEAAVSCPSKSECFAVGTGLLESADGGDFWTPEATPQMLFSDVSCPSTSVCHGVGSSETGSADESLQVIKTTDEGRAWAEVAVPSTSESDNSSFDFISCVTTLDCSVLVDSDYFIQTTDGGSTWGLETFPTAYATTTFSALDCPTSATCFAVGHYTSNSVGVVIKTKDAGTEWTSEAPKKTFGILSGIFCTSVHHCVAVGYFESSDRLDGGGVFVTSDGGTAWTTTVVSPGLFGVTCALGSKCVSVGYSIDYDTSTTTPAILASADGGLKWRGRTAPTGTMTLNAVACASSTTCTALGTGTQSSNQFVVDASSDGGSKWTSGTVPPPIEDITGLACWSSSDCLAVGSTENALQPVDTEGVAITTSNYGTSWAVGATPAGLSKISAVTCVSAADCIAVGTSGQSSPGIDTSSDGGTSWTPATISGDTADMSALSGVACSGSNACMAYGFDMLLLSTDAGQTWAPASLPDNIEIDDVACPASSFCLGVGGNSRSLVPAVYSTTDGGAQWSPQSAPGAAGTSLGGIDCPTADDCVAVGTQDGDGSAFVVTTSNAGGTWTSQDVPAGVTGLADVACVSAEDCTAVGRGSSGGSIVATSDGGVDWTSETLPLNVDNLFSVVCATSSDCLAGGMFDSYGDGGTILGEASSLASPPSI